ncbi:UDP-N-acetylglucosamine 2-epimerase (non-hydrolyzing) [Methylocystis sp. FS]|uniref:non-hydrolyzing UDP-N-acetylglucosamine 2-epimerase n=1 Tax=Methylocystis silviterrae TaxID=2743612 RepID=UPI001581B807|nr:UDP-N-acetylglucosamine 2-epimerase (non-hydrolyzing) [Methylocystis silviterrae]NUJ79330.1 UDP-N-acetylglucosamine 2-epimerase (non-hydrolyzing) [Methylocystis silviterrae]
MNELTSLKKGDIRLSKSKLCCLCVVGTRPEAIKMGPVIAELNHSDWAFPYVVTTGQHADVVEGALKDFGVVPSRRLDLERRNGSLNELFGKVIAEMDRVIDEVQPDCFIAQGDTTSVAVVSLAAFHKNVPFMHIEAGLRTGNLNDPYPEELNRRIAGLTAAMHFAPTSASLNNLLREGVNPGDCLVTGNTGIDALLQTAARKLPAPKGFPNLPRVILATAHRRESFGAPIENALRGIRAAVERHDDLGLFFVSHPNPNAHEPARRILGGHPRIVVTDAIDYADMVAALKRCWIVVTDSGGLQEEAPALGKPVLVLRNTTERPEAVRAGAVRVVGTNSAAVSSAISQLCDDPALYARMAVPVFPYGDGHAAKRIVAAMRARLVRAIPALSAA